MDFNGFEASPKPVLTEPGVKYFLHQTLKQCHIVRDNFHNMIFNIGLFIGFLLVLGLILLYKYKGKVNMTLFTLKNNTIIKLNIVNNLLNIIYNG
jgi:hypothetical protein